MTIACLGISVFDKVFQIDKLPTSGGKYIADHYFETGGGPAATAAVAISRLGSHVELLTRLGTDDIAKRMLDEFKHYHVGCKWIKEIDNAYSQFATILVDHDGERMIINYQDPNLTDDISGLNNVDFSTFDALLCDVRWHKGAKYALQQAQKYKIPSILDADVAPNEIDDLVMLADHIVFSEPGLIKFTQTDNIEKALYVAQKRTNGAVYVTLGEYGCYWLEEGKIQHQSSFKVDVKDTTGAGDVFHGAFALAITENKSKREVIEFSCAVAALKCTEMGGRAGIPTREKVSAFLKNKLYNQP